MRPTPAEGVIPPLVQPVVTTGWYDQYVPTEAPTTLSTAVIGKKVWRDERREKRLKKKRRQRRRQRRLMQEKERLEMEAKAQNPTPSQEKRKGWQILKAYDKRNQELELLRSVGGPSGEMRRYPDEHLGYSSRSEMSSNDGTSKGSVKRIGKYEIRFPQVFDKFLFPGKRNSSAARSSSFTQERKGASSIDKRPRKRVTFKIMSYPPESN